MRTLNEQVEEGMRETPITGAFRNEWPEGRRHNYPCSFESAAFSMLEDMEYENQRLREVAQQLANVIKTSWEHRCSDGVAGCEAVSASASEEAITAFDRLNQ